MRITCCMNCEDRYPSCHSYCEKYKEQKDKWDAVREIRRKELHQNCVADEVQFNGKRR